jgi:glucose/mannose-6-phosphate isomerase
MLGGATFELQGAGADPLARQLDLVALGDYASVYLAILRGVDPTPVDAIVRLKARIARAAGKSR